MNPLKDFEQDDSVENTKLIDDVISPRGTDSYFYFNVHIHSATDHDVRIIEDIIYYKGADHHEKHKLNLYLPIPKDSNKLNKIPVIVHVHGGGWARGDRSTTK